MSDHYSGQSFDMLLMCLRSAHCPTSLLVELETFFCIPSPEVLRWLGISEIEWAGYESGSELALPRPLVKDIETLINVFVAGRRYFGSEERWTSWLLTPHVVLGNMAPFDCLAKRNQRDEVQELLGQMEHGFTV